MTVVPADGCGGAFCSALSSITYGPPIVRFIVADGHLVIRAADHISAYAVPDSGS